MIAELPIDKADRALLVHAPDFWKFRLSPEGKEPAGNGHFYAAKFTTERIVALRARLTFEQEKT